MPASPRGRHAAVFLLGLLGLAGALPAQSDFVLDEDDRWLEQPTPELDGTALQLAKIRRVLATGEYDRAEQMATRWIDRNGSDPLLPEAYLLRGDALYGQEQFYNALFDYEYVARVFPSSDVFVQALQRELDIAQKFARGMRRKFLGMRVFDASEEAEELLIRIQERLPGSQLAEQAGIELADFYFRRRDMEMAVEAYELFVQNYPDSVHANPARRRLIYAHLASFKGPEFDAAGLYEARALLQQLNRQDPVTAQKIGADALLVRIDESDAQKLLVTARWYVRTRDYIAAELTIRRLVEKYPRTVATTDALRLVPRILPRLPERVLEAAPDYEAIRRGMLDGPDGTAGGPLADDGERDPEIEP